MHFKEIKKTATCAWSPNAQQSPLLAVGTISGAMDDSFSSDAHLEIYDLNVQSGANEAASVVASAVVPARFNRLAWSPFSDAPHSSSEGIIIGGMEDGSLAFWNASKLLSGNNNDDALILLTRPHKGPVKGLQVNPFQPFL